MSGTVIIDDGAPDDPVLLAGEHVLGVLAPAESRDVLRRAAREPALSDAIAWWESRLAPLASQVAPVPPPADLWDRVAASVGAAPARPAPRLVSSSPRFWQATTAAAMALAAAVAGFAVLRTPPAEAPRFVAALAPVGGPGASFVAETAPGGAIVVRALAQVPVASGKDLQLWALADGAKAPVSLGVLPAAGRVVQAAELPRAKTQLLISLEPAGGSPTGLPTGPVLFGGTLTQLD